MRSEGAVVDKGQLDRPIVRQVQRTPLGVVELRHCEMKLAGFGKIPLTGPEIQILHWIGGVTLKEAPVKIEKKVCSRPQIDIWNWSDPFRCFSIPYSRGKQRCAGGSRFEQDRTGGKKAAGLENIASSHSRHKRFFLSPEKGLEPLISPNIPTQK